MPYNIQYVQDLYDNSGSLIGVLISPEIWNSAYDKLRPILEAEVQKYAAPEENQEKPEPIEDWNFLLEHWDFKYPVDRSVSCDLCGAHTDNWQEDEPRKFKLKAASLGGLVAFRCNNCRARVTKKHFKEHIVSESVSEEEGCSP
jgi:hypothetical protein